MVSSAYDHWTDTPNRNMVCNLSGGGGLGDLGIRFGYQRFMPEVMAAVVIVLILLVQSIQTLGERLARRANKRIRSS